jgi:hypothetical protein
MPAKEKLVIELTEEQRASIDSGKPVHVRENGHEYVMLRPDIYERLADGGYDDTPWTPDELDRLREESVAMLDSYGKDHAGE